MSEKLEEYVRQSIDKFLKSLPAEERLKGLSPEEQIKALSPETLQLLARQFKGNDSSAKPE